MYNYYLVPAVLGAPSRDVLVVGGGAARAGGASAGAVAAAVGAEGAVEVLGSHGDGAGLAVGGDSNEGDEEEDEGHFD